VSLLTLSARVREGGRRGTSKTKKKAFVILCLNDFQSARREKREKLGTDQGMGKREGGEKGGLARSLSSLSSMRKEEKRREERKSSRVMSQGEGGRERALPLQSAFLVLEE